MLKALGFSDLRCVAFHLVINKRKENLNLIRGLLSFQKLSIIHVFVQAHIGH
jgi:hypothetical protein